MSARLLARLGPSSPYRATIVNGPAGCGKTYAIACALDGMRSPTAHVRLRTPHGDVVRLVRELVDAFAQTRPALAASFPSAVIAGRRSGRPAFVLGEWFARHIGTERAVVAIDELHLIDGSPIRDFIVNAIASSGAEVRWILGSRESHLWPLPGWLARSTVGVPIIMRPREGVRTDAELAAATLDWYAALDAKRATLARALGALPTLDSVCLARLPGSADLVANLAAALPDARSGDHLRPCVRAALAPTDGRYDAATIDRLMTALAGATPSVRLATLTEVGGDDVIVELLDRHGHALIDDNRIDIVERAVDRLSAEAKRACSLALLLEAKRETEFGRHDVAESWYLHAAHIAPDASCRARAEYEFGADLLRRGRPDCIDWLERVVDRNISPDFDVRALAALASALAANDRSEPARAMIAQALARVQDWNGTLDGATEARIYRQAAYIFLRDGDPARATTFARRAIELGERSGLDEIVAGALSVLLVIASSHDDDGDEYLALLKRLERCAHRLDNVFFLRYARLAQLDAYGERAEWSEVERIEKQLASQELENDAIHTDETLIRIRALRLAIAGDFDAASRVLGSAADRHGGDAEIDALRQAELATYAAASGDRAVAHRAIADLAKTLPSVGAPNALKIRTELFATLAEIVLGRRAEAVSRLARIAPIALPYPRMQLLSAALRCLLDLDADRADNTYTAMLESLTNLRDCGLAGIASVLAALPQRLVVR